MTINANKDPMRLRITLQGQVQGFGFRPTIYRIAQSLHLTGSVRNADAGLEIEIEGHSDQIDQFLSQLIAKRPSQALVHSQRVLRIKCLNTAWFEILPDDVRKSLP
jgi:hydrogenase maturation protein HypF